MAIDTVGKILIGGILAITGAEATINVVKYVKARKSRIKAEQELEETLVRMEEVCKERQRKEAEDFERWKAEFDAEMEKDREKYDRDHKRLMSIVNGYVKRKMEEES